MKRVNAGGPSYTDAAGNVWSADKAYAVGSWGHTGGSAKSSSTAVTDTTDSVLYQKYREKPGEYRFTVPNGAYQVTLKFAEFTVSNNTDRAMSIAIEGMVYENPLSVYAVVGRFRALDATYIVQVNDGVLNIAFARASGASKDPAVSAIEVFTTQASAATPTATPTPTGPTSTPTLTPTPVPFVQRVHAGSAVAYVDSQGLTWSPDRSYVDGSWGYTTGAARSSTTVVANTVDDPLYQKWRELRGEYRFTVPNGAYRVTLKFAEFIVNKPEDRGMMITIEGVVSENPLSVYAQAGKNTAFERSYTATVSDGVLNIAFDRAINARKDPAISAIEVKSQ